jgi:ComEC/Rec2-related protein
VAATGALCALWLLGRGLWPQALIFAALLAPIALHGFWALPRAEAWLAALAPEAPLRVTGTVREIERVTAQGGGRTRVRLGEATLAAAGRSLGLAEVEARFPAPIRPWGARRRTLSVGGPLLSTGREGGRLVLEFGEAGWHFAAEPIGWGERLRRALADRAGYYLPHRSLAVYLPIVLGVRDHDSPEGREVAGAFTRVGVAHLFAISGLHVGMLFLLFLGIARTLQGLGLRGQGWVHARAAGRIAVTAAIWIYIALIGFPVPAVRAAAMGTMVMAGQLGGTRTPPVYLLALAALALLLPAPTLIYDLSFQLSFLAYFFLLVALALWERRPRPEERGSLAGRLVSGAALNLLVTFCITAGLWPLLALVFQRFSLLVFAGNLLMVPPMSVLVLPAGLAGLAANLAALGSVPGGWIERAVFAVLDAVLQGWIALAEAIDRAGAALIFHVTLHWSPRTWFLYYAALLAAQAAALAWLRRRERAGQTGNEFEMN